MDKGVKKQDRIRQSKNKTKEKNNIELGNQEEQMTIKENVIYII